MVNINLPTSVLNKLSKDSRERIITIEARLSELDDEIYALDYMENKLDSGQSLL